MEEKLTPEEIQKILKEHQLWLDSGGKEGKQADFSGRDLEGANLEGANLKGANFGGANLKRANLGRASLWGASLLGTNLLGANLLGATLLGATLMGTILKGANLKGANLKGANLKGANLKGANLKGVSLKGVNLEEVDLEDVDLEGVDLEGAIGINRNIDKAIELRQNVQEKEQHIQHLKTKLKTMEASAENNEEEIRKLKEKIQAEQSYKQKYEKKLEQLEEQNKQLKKELSGRIKDAKESLEKALKNTDAQIQSNHQSAQELGKIAKFVLVFVTLALFVIPIYIWISDNLPDNNWHIIFYTFPILTLMLITTTLLRHQKALLNEVRYFSMMKHQIELYSGLLEASQHAAASMGDTQKANEYVQETFTQIRNRLLSEQIRQDYHQQSESKEEDLGSDKIINLLDKITNLANKKPS